MDKATPTPSPATVDSVMALAEVHSLAAFHDGRNNDNRRSQKHIDAYDALHAEAERLAAQSAPTLLDAFKSGNVILIDWPMEPVTPQEALKLMDMMDAEYVKTMGKLAPDREMAVSMQRVRHMACALWASQKEVMRSHFVELAAAQSAPAETSAVVSAPKFTRLKFFRDLSNDERMRMLRVFMDLSTIPDDAIKTHGVQRQLFDRVFAVAQSAQAPAQAVQEARCACNDRPASECPGEWEPGCDLGNNPKYVRAYVDAGRTIPPSGEIGGA